MGFGYENQSNFPLFTIKCHNSHNATTWASHQVWTKVKGIKANNKEMHTASKAPKSLF